MSYKKKLFIKMGISGIFLVITMCYFSAMAISANAEGPKLGSVENGPSLDKSQDAFLQKMIKEVTPKFRQLEFSQDGLSMKYNLFIPEKLESGKKYPLVLFMADASTPGSDAQKPLTQGYGALIFADPKSQAKNPCYVLVPQFSGVAVNDSWQRTPEVEFVLKLMKNVVENNPVDPKRVYATGQSMGGMISMYYTIAHPGIFAASLFVDCHWDSTEFDKLVEHPFIFIYAGSKGKSWQNIKEIETAARKMSVGYTWSEWSARLPLPQQNALAATQLEKNKPINLIGFEDGTVLPQDGKGSEHMYAFDKAYQIAPTREWLFNNSLKK